MRVGTPGVRPKANYPLCPVLGQSCMLLLPHSEDGGEDYYHLQPHALAGQWAETLGEVRQSHLTAAADGSASADLLVNLAAPGRAGCAQ